MVISRTLSSTSAANNDSVNCTSYTQDYLPIFVATYPGLGRFDNFQTGPDTIRAVNPWNSLKSVEGLF